MASVVILPELSNLSNRDKMSNKPNKKRPLVACSTHALGTFVAEVPQTASNAVKDQNGRRTRRRDGSLSPSSLCSAGPVTGTTSPLLPQQL